MRDRLYPLLPKPRAGRAKAFKASAVRRLLVLARLPNPTYTYYLEERLARQTMPWEVVDLSDRLELIDPNGVFVILCRYALPRQLIWLYRNRSRLAGVALLVDDNVAATVMSDNGSLKYRLYLMALGVLPLYALNPLLTHVWASTPVLAEQLSLRGHIDVLPPVPPRHTLTPCKGAPRPKADGPCMVFHATGAHLGEHRFLIPIVEEALRRHPALRIEVAGAGQAGRLWQSAAIDPARLAIVAPMPWPCYVKTTAQRPEGAIALVPLLSNRVNDARSTTKRFDICRMEAAAIFSRAPAYLPYAAEGEILVDNDPASWLEAIASLAGDADLRRRANRATMAAVETLLETVQPGFPGLDGSSSNPIR